MKGANELEKVKTYEGLPEVCFGINDGAEEVVVIVRGESGYYPFGGGIVKGEDNVKRLNDGIGVTPAQMEAMKVGSMFGWDSYGANPANYDENGLPRLTPEGWDVAETSVEEPEAIEYVTLSTYAQAVATVFPAHSLLDMQGVDVEFAVRVEWLYRYLMEQDGRTWLQFRDEYTYDDTEPLFHKAHKEKALVWVNVPAMKIVIGEGV